MIDPVSTQLNPQNLLGQLGKIQENPAAAAARLREAAPGGSIEFKPVGKTGTDFAGMVSDLVRAVDDKSKVAAHEARQLMLGESDNLHQSMIAMQESGLAFTLLVEVRNKLVESYQELMRMPV